MALPTPDGYRMMDENELRHLLAGLPDIVARLGGDSGSWQVREVGDGNLNLVFIVEGNNGGICVKQALPYVRLVGESWPLDLNRAFFEYRASVIQAEHCHGLVPQILHYEPTLFLIVMELLSPHIIMRRGMIDAVIYPRFVEHITDYMARSLFFTSDLALPAAQRKAMITEFCPNTDLCKITEDLIFTHPYMVHELNRWTSPQLDGWAAAWRGDDQLKLAISRLKLDFLSRAEALLHGDLHTGSIMVTPDETRVIDPEFAFVGPMAFDIGKLLGNLVLNFFSHDGHETVSHERDAYRAWVVETIHGVWHGFAQKFLDLWTRHRTGDAYPRDLLPEGSAIFAQAQNAFIEQMWTDAVRYAGASMIRRTLGLAHNADLERIEDPDRRAACEKRVLELARDLVVNAGSYASVEQVTGRARAIRERDLG
ncbi:MAG TPA: S-methyl-5-thioribose kinase [Geminicoccus sp.]|jgi:5-methylthioribose kinase|uniref:S-methyl-5-thioribose kinase n=1 Tax=Geminicoccus sp. TaxID=2024832 RepID=UPI002E30DCC9|nr:S-methyl-5-thioribose kinase [Geminicoccus sp.]HEX2526984.1 S-methyl-5-thioribose kinase [Geminicoccus sp.]